MTAVKELSAKTAMVPLIPIASMLDGRY